MRRPSKQFILKQISFHVPSTSDTPNDWQEKPSKIQYCGAHEQGKLNTFDIVMERFVWPHIYTSVWMDWFQQILNSVSWLKHSHTLCDCVCVWVQYIFDSEILIYIFPFKNVLFPHVILRQDAPFIYIYCTTATLQVMYKKRGGGPGLFYRERFSVWLPGSLSF